MLMPLTKTPGRPFTSLRVPVIVMEGAGGDGCPAPGGEPGDGLNRHFQAAFAARGPPCDPAWATVDSNRTEIRLETPASSMVTP